MESGRCTPVPPLPPLPPPGGTQGPGILPSHWTGPLQASPDLLLHLRLGLAGEAVQEEGAGGAPRLPLLLPLLPPPHPPPHTPPPHPPAHHQHPQHHIDSGEEEEREEREEAGQGGGGEGEVGPVQQGLGEVDEGELQAPGVQHNARGGGEWKEEECSVRKFVFSRNAQI